MPRRTAGLVGVLGGEYASRQPWDQNYGYSIAFRLKRPAEAVGVVDRSDPCQPGTGHSRRHLLRVAAYIGVFSVTARSASALDLDRRSGQAVARPRQIGLVVLDELCADH